MSVLNKSQMNVIIILITFVVTNIGVGKIP